MSYTQILSKRYNFDPDKWRIEDKLKTSKFYYAIIHDKNNGDFIYHSIASKGKNQWQFETEAKLKVSLTNGVTRGGYFTQKLIDEGIIEIKTGINNITTE